MYSFKNIYSENINADALCLVTGATRCGKSWFLKTNMRKFQGSGIKPIVIHYDMKNAKMLSFDVFLHSFEKTIINTLVEYNKRSLSDQTSKAKSLATTEQMLSVAFRFYDKNLLEH